MEDQDKKALEILNKYIDFSQNGVIDRMDVIKAMNEFVKYKNSEAVVIIENLKTYGMIHTVEGVVYSDGSHEHFINEADKWLYNYHIKKN